MFVCEQLFLAQSWNHVAVVMQKPAIRGKAKATVYINGVSIGVQKVCFVCCACAYYAYVHYVRTYVCTTYVYIDMFVCVCV